VNLLLEKFFVKGLSTCGGRLGGKDKVGGPSGGGGELASREVFCQRIEHLRRPLDRQHVNARPLKAGGRLGGKERARPVLLVLRRLLASISQATDGVED
jgi:hypothetical protein